MITNDRVINRLLDLRESIIRPKGRVALDDICILKENSGPIIKKIESMILDEIKDDRERRGMIAFFELDV